VRSVSKPSSHRAWCVAFLPVELLSHSDRAALTLATAAPPSQHAGMRFRVTSPYGGIVECTVPVGYGPGMRIHVQLPPAHGQDAPPPAAWVCPRCTLQNEGGAAACAACDAPRPPSEDEQLRAALAASQLCAPAPRLAMAEAAEAEAIRLSIEEQERRMRARVDANVLRVAGDSRGTASTLVGLSPEDELELAMLKSRVAAEEPPQPAPPKPLYAPKAYSSYSSSLGVEPLAPLPRIPHLSPPPRKAEVGLKQSLLDGEPLDTHTEPSRQPAYQPPVMPVIPNPPPPHTPMASGDRPTTLGERECVSSEDEWDDSDRPLAPLQLGSRSDSSCQQRHTRSGGAPLAGGYAHLD